MKNFRKKICAIFVILVFCTSGIATASLIHTPKVRTDLSKDTSMRTVIVCRYGPDGSAKLIKTNIVLNGKQNFEKILAEKCSELAEDDDEIQKYLKDIVNENDTERTSMFSIVKSHGKGLHFKTKLPFRTTRSLLFPRLRTEMPFKVYVIIHNKAQIRHINIVYCKYSNDAQANTTVTSLFKTENATRYIEGNHTVFALGFIGYTGWLGHFSLTPFNLQPRTFAGYATFVTYS